MFQVCKLAKNLQSVARMSDKPVDFDYSYIEIPHYDIDKPQTLDTRKAR